MAERTQDTGNPVLDSTVNIFAAGTMPPTPQNLEGVHTKLLELAKKEPGGLKVRAGNALVDVSGEK